MPAIKRPAGLVAAGFDGLAPEGLGLPVAVRPPEARIPLRMRTGARARIERARVNATDFLRWHLGDRLPRPIATRVEDLRRLRETPSQ